MQLRTGQRARFPTKSSTKSARSTLNLSRSVRISPDRVQRMIWHPRYSPDLQRTATLICTVAIISYLNCGAAFSQADADFRQDTQRNRSDALTASSRDLGLPNLSATNIVLGQPAGSAATSPSFKVSIIGPLTY